MLGARRLPPRTGERTTSHRAQLALLWSDAIVSLPARVLQGNFDAGIAEFTAALAADPNYERAYFGRAECLRCKGQLQEAEVSSAALCFLHM